MFFCCVAGGLRRRALSKKQRIFWRQTGRIRACLKRLALILRSHEVASRRINPVRFAAPSSFETAFQASAGWGQTVVLLLLKQALSRARRACGLCPKASSNGFFPPPRHSPA